MTQNQLYPQALDFITKHLDKCFQAPSQNFYRFLQQYQNITNWIIASDYCLNDKNKPNDTIALTFIPCCGQKTLLKDIQGMAPKDIKDTKIINEDFLQYLKSDKLFHVCILYEKADIFGTSNKDATLQADYILSIINAYKMKVESIKNEYLHTYFVELCKKVKLFRAATTKGSFNVKLFQQMAFLNYIVGYFISLIAANTKSKKIAWASDRDAMIAAYHEINLELMALQYNNACSRRQGKKHSTKLIIFDPRCTINSKGKTSKHIWYDPLIRIPDYIAGTFADCQIDTNQSTHDKFVQVATAVVPDNKNFELHKLGLKKTGVIVHTHYKWMPHS